MRFIIKIKELFNIIKTVSDLIDNRFFKEPHHEEIYFLQTLKRKHTGKEFTIFSQSSYPFFVF